MGNMRTRFLLAFILALTLTHGIAGCSGKSVDENDPGALMKDAEEDVKSDHYSIALDKFREVKNKYPYSKFALEAQLRIADIYYMQESYGEAAAAYEAFKDLHPKHEKVSYAMFRAAKSYFKDIPDPIARDMTPATKAMDAYNDFLRRFPADANAAEARGDLAKTRNLLAQKELYVGDFYYKREFYDSAKPRYEKILALYPDTETATAAKDKLQLIENYKKAHPNETTTK
jgi:outer membrane protein assembly factor BamD